MTESTEIDLISELLDTSRLKATVYANPRGYGAWQIVGTSASPVFQLVARGSCWLKVKDRAPLPLSAGDLVVLLRGGGYVLSANASADGGETRMPAPDGEPVTELVSGRFDFGDALAGEILDDLPDLLVIRNDSARLEGLARLLAVEAASAAPGRKVALDRLSDLLFVAVLRHLMERGGIARGLLAALTDPRLASALATMHGNPSQRWTLQSLARQAGMSRTVFTQRFGALMGTTPLRWLTRLRMHKARALLAPGGRPVGSVAAEVGYESEAAFRRAYAKWRARRPISP